jgi:mono/diheme cytochrome c family protein
MSRVFARAARALGALCLVGVFAEPAAAEVDGKGLYAQNCSACHQPAGQGVKGAFPALSGDAVVLGPAPAAALVVLNGRGGMPAFGPDLDDQTIAAVLSYVRSSWGNSASPLTPSVVAGVRSGKEPEAQNGSVQAH